MHSVDMSKMLLCSKFEDCNPFGYVETDVNITGEIKFPCSRIREI